MTRCAWECRLQGVGAACLGSSGGNALEFLGLACLGVLLWTALLTCLKPLRALQNPDEWSARPQVKPLCLTYLGFGMVGGVGRGKGGGRWDARFFPPPQINDTTYGRGRATGCMTPTAGKPGVATRGLLVRPGLTVSPGTTIHPPSLQTPAPSAGPGQLFPPGAVEGRRGRDPGHRHPPCPLCCFTGSDSGGGALGFGPVPVAQPQGPGTARPVPHHGGSHCRCAGEGVRTGIARGRRQQGFERLHWHALGGWDPCGGAGAGWTTRLALCSRHAMQVFVLPGCRHVRRRILCGVPGDWISGPGATGGKGGAMPLV